jgi:CBS domain containing-hemolysin-like protein
VVVAAVLTVAAGVAMVAAAYCAYADGALLAVDEDEPPPPADVAPFVQRRERAHRALAFGRITSQLLGGAAAVAAIKASPIPPVQVAPLVVVAGILVVVLAESAARAAGASSGVAGLRTCNAGVRAVEGLMAPVVALGAWVDRMVEALIPPGDHSAAEREATVEQFREAVEAEAGVSADDARLLRGVFSLGDTTVQDIMVPRVDVFAINRAAAWADVVAHVRSARHSRYPVYEGTLDNVVGVVHAKDLLPAVLAGAPPPDGWTRLVRPAQFIPATKRVDAQLRDFKASRLHLAIVVDEFGGTAGIVTLEDALEVIVGEIRDEHDVEEPEVRQVSPGRFSVSARVPLDDLRELTGALFDRDGVHTVGGLVYAIVGAVPRQGDRVVTGGYRLTVERVARRRIMRVGVERVEDAT